MHILNLEHENIFLNFIIFQYFNNSKKIILIQNNDTYIFLKISKKKKIPFMLIYISCADSTGFPDFLSPFVPIINRSW